MVKNNYEIELKKGQTVITNEECYRNWYIPAGSIAVFKEYNHEHIPVFEITQPDGKYKPNWYLHFHEFDCISNKSPEDWL